MQNQYYQRRKMIAQQKELRRQIYQLAEQRQELVDQLYDLLEDLGVRNNRKRKIDYFPFSIMARFIYNGLIAIEQAVYKVVAAIFKRR